jgi:RNA polymerase sigma-70 factor (ECF subfamily)
MTTPASSFAIDVPDDLVARMRRGDRAAFEQVYRWFERPVYTLALRMCGDRELAADVLQETMLRLVDRVDGFRGARSGEARPFWGWLRQIAVNEALMALRRARRDGALQTLDDGPEPADDLTPPPPVAADVARLQQALDALPTATRAVLWLYHAEGYTHDEIAAAMQRTASFSKSQLARGTRRLRALLEPATDAVAREVAHG